MVKKAKRHPKVKEIAIDGSLFDEMTAKVSRLALQTGGATQPPIMEFFDSAAKVNSIKALTAAGYKTYSSLYSQENVKCLS